MSTWLDLIDVVKVILRRKKQLLIICGIALVAGVIISDPHIMKPYYLSTAIVVPANPSLSTTQNLFADNSVNSNYYGSEEDGDRLLAIANSAPLEQNIISQFHLFNHYKIDSVTTSYPNYKIQREFESNYEALKDDKDAIEINVYDHDPKMASDIANAIVDKVDDINRNIILSNKNKMLAIYQNKVTEKQMQLHQLTDSIVKLKRLIGISGGIESLGNMASGNSNGIDREGVQEKIYLLEDQQQGSVIELNNSNTMLEEFQASINKDVPTLYVLQRAFPAEMKSKPLRSLVVLAFVAGAFFITLLILLIIQRYPRFRALLQNDEPRA
jgi:capsular polysaccharide biosynthesis protein